MSLADYYMPSKDIVIQFFLSCVLSYIIISALGISWIYQFVFFLFNYHYSCRIRDIIKKEGEKLTVQKLVKDAVLSYLIFIGCILIAYILAKSYMERRMGQDIIWAMF